MAARIFFLLFLLPRSKVYISTPALEAFGSAIMLSASNESDVVMAESLEGVTEQDEATMEGSESKARCMH